MKRILYCTGSICAAEGLLWLLLLHMQKVDRQLFVLFLVMIFMMIMAVVFVLADIRGRCENIGYLVTHMRNALLITAGFGAADVLLWYGLLRNHTIGGFWLGIILTMLISALIMAYAYGAALTILNREEKQ